MRKLIVKRCLKCGATVEILKDCKCKNCGIQCCNQSMVELKPNTSDGAAEKHLPVYEVVGEYVVVTVPHVMTEEHYIEYVAISCDKVSAKKFFKPGDVAKAIFPYIKGSKLYSHCNKHGIWSIDVK
ncbi:MAG: desulfoferrodoxin [Clostridia bacterium]|nr:desulfoferrodoxin [Clostridia bacterium]